MTQILPLFYDDDESRCVHSTFPECKEKNSSCSLGILTFLPEPEPEQISLKKETTFVPFTLRSLLSLAEAK